MSFSENNIVRALYFVRAGQYELIPAAVASAAAAYVSAHKVESGTPLLIGLNQTLLPQQEIYECTAEWSEVVCWIQELIVRGAPALGCAGAAAVCMAAHSVPDDELPAVLDCIAQARPTAVNLPWAVNHIASVLPGDTDAVFSEVLRLFAEDEKTNRLIGMNGAELVPLEASVLTHCNAGSLATSFFGTALGVIYAAASQGKIKRVYADETRPVGQGSRLTAWELSKAEIPVTLLCDNMAASLMSQGCVDMVIVGADRIACNGDTANKIGTLGVAILAQHFDIPFYVAAPSSTIDPQCLDGSQIQIEVRSTSEVLPHTISGVEVYNPAFDVTPARLISGIITERGVFSPREIECNFCR